MNTKHDKLNPEQKAEESTKYCKGLYYSTGAYLHIGYNDFLNTLIDSWFVKSLNEYSINPKVQ